jgi:5-methylcytosine-specific restriction endonuclease McrA
MPRDKPTKANIRPDHNGNQRAQFESNKKKIYATQTVCGICGKPVEFRYKFPHPLSPCIDHIIPVSKGGHPSDISNLQLAHMTCNRFKSDKLTEKQDFSAGVELISNRVLPLTFDWKTL